MRRKLDLLADDRVRLPAEVARRELRDDLVRVAYIRGEVVLDSGVQRKYYFDKYMFETNPAILRQLGRFLAELVPRDTDRLAAPALGAIALGTAVVLELGIPMVIVRPHSEADPRKMSPVEGGVYPGEMITLIEDVIVTGSRAIRAIEKITDAGAQVGTVVTVLDCLADARQRFAEAGIQYEPVFTTRELGIE